MASKAALTRRVSVTKVRITSTANNLIRDVNDITIEALKPRGDILDEAWKEFKIAYDELLNQCEEAGIEEIMEVEVEYQRKYTSAKAVADVRLKSINVRIENNTATTDTNQLIEIRLPKIDIPSFNGRYEDWLTFRDAFVTTIHETKMSKKTKVTIFEGCIRRFS